MPPTQIPDLEAVFARFRTGQTFRAGAPYGNGHIHDTFRVETAEGGHGYILQRLNTNIFKDVPGLMSNIERVTRHIRAKLERTPGADPLREGMTLVPTGDGKTWTTDGEGRPWRMYVFITDHRSYDIVDSPDKAFQGGKAIGRFQAQLADLAGGPLGETIPRFHDISWRLEAFRGKLAEDRVGRAAGVKDEADFVLARAEEMRVVLDLGAAGRIPVRTTHNDTKFNNVLLDAQDKALCVIDLDTVMPGYVHYDFGDAIRTATNTAAEDEVDLPRVSMDLGRFQAWAEGYLSETGATLNRAEKDHLAFAPRLITYTIAVRFLTDWLDGDRYFKVRRPGHNLERARAQLQLLRSMEAQHEDMRRAVARLG